MIFVLYWNRFQNLKFYYGYDSDSNSDSRKNGIITPLVHAAFAFASASPAPSAWLQRSHFQLQEKQRQTKIKKRTNTRMGNWGGKVSWTDPAISRGVISEAEGGSQAPVVPRPDPDHRGCGKASACQRSHRRLQ